MTDSPAARLDRAAADVHAALVAAARNGQTVYYEDLFALTGAQHPALSMPTSASLSRVLNIIAADCAARGEPDVTVLLRRQDQCLTVAERTSTAETVWSWWRENRQR
ncbi:hypothetical protein DQ238_21790 [Geodermatophilus sp. TF02-6]|uniref:hypothetical protein n=1 Tax=Geodermatophilus sp. TF02-6 TaxID=2250575 RepID=UPI000DE93141|nr:hypothetical protein [Geodermatophilus sp. TF02-6]RBY74546.1 hypothetical protein DQ238_21790 [Geodermatophilus sp. TF02-6]